MQPTFTVHLAKAGLTFCTGHHFSVRDVFDASLVHKDVVYIVQMFGPCMHPGGWNMLVVITSYCSVQSSSRKRPLLLHLSTPCICILTYADIKLATICRIVLSYE